MKVVASALAVGDDEDASEAADRARVGEARPVSRLVGSGFPSGWGDTKNFHNRISDHHIRVLLIKTNSVTYNMSYKIWS